MFDIEETHQLIVNKLTDSGKIIDVSLQLFQNRTNEERVAFVYDLLIQYELMPKFKKTTKNPFDSKECRNKGNKFFQNKNDFDALLYYSKAILSAPPNSEELALAYGNRSAALFSLKNYEGSCVDIARAYEQGYPERLKEKLENRMKQCKKLMQTPSAEEKRIESECKAKFSISKDLNSSIPCASIDVDLRYNQQMGRHVVAKSSIYPGEVIAVEKPYVTVLLKDLYLTRCYNCLSLLDYLIPCNGCCDVMFCNEKCRDESWSSYHKHECPIMTLLLQMKFTKLELHALRVVLKALYDYGSWEKLRSSIEEAENSTDPVYQGFMKNEETPDGILIFDSKNYLAVHSLATNLEKRSASDVFMKCVTAAVMLYLLDNYTDCFNNIAEINRFNATKFIGGLLFYHGMTVPTNMHSLAKLYQSKSGDCSNSACFGCAAYVFLSMLNHSCSPNVVRSSSGTTTALVALRPIKTGDQLFDNYGFHHSLDTYTHRQDKLKFQYKFNCVCEACTFNWPLYIHLKDSANWTRHQVKTMKDCLLTTDRMDALRAGDRKLALDLYNGLCACAEALEELAPCREVADYQETLKHCWSLFDGFVPYRESQFYNIEGLE